MTNTAAAPSGPTPDEARKARLGAARKTWLVRIAVVLAVLAILWLIYWFLIGSHHVSTDDAYVNAETADITALVSGPIVQSTAGDTEQVRRGQVLAVIDPVDYRVALDKARAQLGQAERRVTGYFASAEGYGAQIEARQADVARAEAQLTQAGADVARASDEYRRRQTLIGTGAVAQDELDDAKNRLQTAAANLKGAQAGVAQAKANVTAAGQQRRSAEALVEGASLSDNPEVAAARAQVDAAALDLDRTVIRSPIDGVVARHNIHVGQRVQTGAQLMTVVPIQSAYVDANFKEVQLRRIRIGDAVTLTSDLYGHGVKFHGKVMGVSGGSGAAFSLIPAQNATGNWIKVVQRVPVRISLDPRELKSHPLRVGLSMKAEVEVR